MKTYYVNVYWTKRDVLSLGYARFRTAKTAFTQRTRDGTFAYTLMLTPLSVRKLNVERKQA